MKDLSLHILDIVQNSIRANGKVIRIDINEDQKKNELVIDIMDNGMGVEKNLINKIRDPFYTTRTTRKTGLGIPLLEQAARQTGGDLLINSKLGRGTHLNVKFVYDHIDRPPLGNISATMINLIGANPEVQFVYSHRINNNIFEFNTEEIKTMLDDIPINHPKILDFIKNMLMNEISNMSKCNEPAHIKVK